MSTSHPQTIEIVIDSLGNLRLQTKGFTGVGCRNASLALEQALGMVVADQPTSELYQSIPATQPQPLKS